MTPATAREGSPADNEESPGFFEEERDWMSEFLADDWVDAFRHLNPKKEKAYTWWSFRTRARVRNVGWRIDYNCFDKQSLKKLVKAEIQNKVLGSDHCPVTLELKGSL